MMGVPIKRVEFNFTLTTAQAELFDDMINTYQGELIGDKFNKVNEMIQVVIKGSNAVQED